MTMSKKNVWAALFAAVSGVGQANDPVGTWRGISQCVVKPSSCNDEDSVYRISPVANASERVTVSANKIVDGREVNIGTSECTVTQKDHVLRCPLPNGASMQLTVKADAIDGRFQLADGTLWRRISLTRSR